MPSSHLPRTPCDKFVYEFLCDFLGIVGGYGLRHMYSHCIQTSCIFLLRGLRGNPGLFRTETVRRLYGNRAMSVQLPSSLRSLRTEIVRSLCGDRHSHGAHAGIVQCHLRHVYGLRSYNFSKFVKLLAKPNHRGHGARESVRKSHSRLLPPQGGLAEAARKGGYGQDTGSVDSSQAKCELGISHVNLHHHWGHPPLQHGMYMYMHAGQANVLSTLLMGHTYVNTSRCGVECRKNVQSGMWYISASEVMHRMLFQVHVYM